MKNRRIIKKNHEFQSIISKKRSIASSNFILYYDKNPNSGVLRYGISVGKKLGNAVVRNHIKRSTRMIINSLLESYGDLSYSVVILVRKRFVYKTYEENQANLKDLFKQFKKKISK